MSDGIRFLSGIATYRNPLDHPLDHPLFLFATIQVLGRMPASQLEKSLFAGIKG